MKLLNRVTKVSLVCLLCLGAVISPNLKVMAQGDDQITNITAKAKSTAGHEATLALDGDRTTYYMTPSSSSMDDHYRNIDLILDGMYDISKIKIYNNEGSYNQYQIYTSTDGNKFEKVAYKNDENMASATGDEYLIDVSASQVRINLGYNSKQMEGNLAEVELYGTRTGEADTYEGKIEVTDFEDSKWSEEYSKFENDPDYANQKVINEMSAMVGRVIGEKWVDSFIFELREDNDKKDIFEVENGDDDKIIIRGNNGISMASGFNHYLRFFCNVDYNPVFVSQLNMPEQLPRLEQKIVKETQYDYRYALNFCTYSYTMAFWDWEDYQAFLDWSAMSGINTMLDIVGQEEVIRRSLKEYGYSDKEIKEYISGPGYFAWYYMQNMTSYGGPLPDNWFEDRVELGRKMHDRMQTYGITPVLSGFSGMVPRNFKEKFKDATTVSQGGWCGYERPDMLRTYLDGDGKDYFSEMADVFYQAQQDIFGDVTNIYAVDPFHEGGNIGNMNVTKVYETVQKKMIENDDDAIWLIQQWSGSMTDAKLQGLKVKDQALVLDLFSEINPSSGVMERNEIPWVWNMLHNFGGRMGLDANPEKVSQNIPNSYNNSKFMKGIGMTPEGIENSPMAYELLWDMTWTSDPIDFRQWCQDYAKRNYGGTNEDIQEVWDILLETGYNRKDNYYQGAPESVINARPTTNFTSASSWGHSTINYDKKELERAVQLMARNYDEFKDSPAFVYDLSDITRQLISNSAQEYHKAMVNAYQSNNLAEFETLSDQFLEIILLQDQILSTNSDFLVGKWIDQARTMLDDGDDWTKDLFEFNARDLITTWGGLKNANNGGLRDYSNRQWAGVTKDYYYPRWEKWISDVKTAMETGSSIPSTNWFLMEWQWANQKSDEAFAYSTTPSTLNLEDLAMEAYDKYSLANLEKLVGNIEEKENLALGKTVMASIPTNPNNPTTNLTDGSKETTWMATENAGEYSLTVDLEAQSSIDGMEIALKQIAGGFPYSYKVEVLKDGEWTTVAQNDDGEITSQTMIDYRGIGSQVKFTFMSDDSTIIPEVAELLIYGKSESKVNYENVALNKPVNTPEGVTNKITDGNPGTLWVKSNGTYPCLLTLDLGSEEYVDVMEIYFEKPGLRYQYDVIVEDASGKQTVIQDMTENTEDLAGMYKLAINAKIQKVYVNLKSRAEGGDFNEAWPALAEIKLLQEKELEFTNQNVAYGKPGFVINDVNPYNSTKLTDGSITGLENVGSDIFPTTFAVDLGSEQALEEVRIYFEKAGIRFKFKVEVENAKGEKTVIMDKTDNTEDLEASYTIPAKMTGQKINVVIEGRAPGGQSYLASPAMTEIEAYAKPKNVIKESVVSSNIDLTDEEISALIDGNQETFIEFDSTEAKEIVFDLEQPVDLYAYELYKLSEGALQYKIEYIPDEGNDWISLVDESNNLSDSKKYVNEFKSILTKKVKLTIYNEYAKIADFNLYQTDATIELSSYIGSIESKLSKLAIGEYAGNYSPAAKEVLNKEIAAAKAKIDSNINSSEVEAEKKKLAKAYNEFLKSYVSIDRTGLLVEILEVKELLSLDELKDNLALKEAYNNAMSAYNTYKITQQQLDANKDVLVVAKEAALTLLESKDQYKVKLNEAKELLENTEVGESSGNVSQDTADLLAGAITKAESDYQTANTVEQINQIIEAIDLAVTEFKNNIIGVNKTELQTLYNDYLMLQEADYTAASWAPFKEAMDDAKAILDQEDATQEEVDKAKTALQTAKDGLVEKDTGTTNKLALQIAIDVANNAILDNVVPAVVKEFNKALENAIAINDKTNATQEEVDKAFDRLAKAMQMLEFFIGDKTALNDFINELKELELKETEYTKGTWEIYQAALNTATGVVANENAMQEEVNQTYQELVNKANSLDAANYSVESWARVANALNDAKAVLENPEATNEEVNNANNALTKALSGLVETTSNSVNTETPVKPGDSSALKTGDDIAIGALVVLMVAGAFGYYVARKKKDLN